MLGRALPISFSPPFEFNLFLAILLVLETFQSGVGPDISRDERQGCAVWLDLLLFLVFHGATMVPTDVSRAKGPIHA